MEELQDAIEDAQYVNAISTQEDGPRPMQAWEIPSDEQLALWKERTGKRATFFTLDNLLQSATGVFLFSAFLKDTCNDYLRINFCEEVLRWKRLRGRQRVEKARKMIANYLSAPKKDDITGLTMMPAKSEIDEFDLERRVKKPSDIGTLYSQNYSESSSVCLLGIDGPVRDELLLKMKAVEEARAAAKRNSSTGGEAGANGIGDYGDEEGAPSESKTSVETAKSSATTLVDGKSSHHFRLDSKQPSGPRYLPDNFFDMVEIVVMESLRRQYWSAFQASEEYRKLLNFLWYQDRRVVPEDFFVMRVLGRGGFGLVNGKSSCVLGGGGSGSKQQNNSNVARVARMLRSIGSILKPMNQDHPVPAARHVENPSSADNDTQTRTNTDRSVFSSSLPHRFILVFVFPL